MTLRDKVVIITGASSGIGRATAKRLDSCGMHCVLTARSEDKLRELAEELNQAIVVPGDITDPAQPKKLLDTTLEKYGRIDVLFNNAGSMHIGSVEEIDIEAVCKMIRLNVEAVIRLSYTVLKHMQISGSGFIINTSSLAGLKTFPYFGAYNGSKHAIEAFSDALRMELAGSGIRVAAIAPGRTDTGLYDHWQERKKFKPEEGFLDPGDVARCVQFILEQPEEMLVSRLMVVPSRQPR